MTFPSFTTSANVGTKQDAIHNSVGSHISSPKFVDNAVHHAAYKVTTDVTTGKTLGLSRPTSSDFQVALGKGYDYTEEVGALQLTHAQVPGVNDQVPVFYNDSRLVTGSSAPLSLFSGDDRILTDTVTTKDKASEIILQNTSGRTLSQLGLVDDSLLLQAGQIVNVGLRTTDLAMRLFDGKTHSLNSVSLSLPYSGSRSGVDNNHPGSSLLRHSTTFLSRDFRLVAIPQALRFIARHDNYLLYSDRYGNFIYAPSGFSQTDRKIESMIAENVRIDPMVDIANSIIVRGDDVALNNNNIAQVNDAEMQKRDGMIKTTTIRDPTANTKASARRSANQMLRLNRKAQSSIKSKGHIRAWDLQPGDVIDYITLNATQPLRTGILEATHYHPENVSKFTLLSYDVGIEEILNSIDVALETDSDSGSPRLDNSIKQTEYSAIGLSNISVRSVMHKREVMNTKPRGLSTTSGITFTNTGVDNHSGFLIGHRGFDTGNASGRGAIGTGVAPRTVMSSVASGSGQGAYVLNVTSNTGFPTSGSIIINESIHATYTGKGSGTLTGVNVEAPSNGTISGSNLPLRLLRTRSHEIGTVKGEVKKVRL